MEKEVKNEINEINDIKLLRWGAWLQLIAIVLFGPLLVLLLGVISPQPAWQDGNTFSQHYEMLQSLPYWGGFILIAGNLLFVVCAGRFPATRDTARFIMAIVALSVYSSLVALNYLVQVAYISMAAKLPPVYVELFSMANPDSIAWPVEMFAYAILGVALWLIAPSFQGNRVRNAIRRLLVFDAIASILGAVLAVIFKGGMLDEGALAGYYFWNILVVVIAALVLYEYREKRASRLAEYT